MLDALEAQREAVGFEQLQLRRPDRQARARRRRHAHERGRLRAAVPGAVGAGINIEMISTSEIRISVVTRADQLIDAVQVVHSAFDLDGDRGRRRARRDRPMIRRLTQEPGEARPCGSASSARRARSAPSCCACSPSAGSRSRSSRLFASARSAGHDHRVPGRRDHGRGCRSADPTGLDVAIFSAGGATSRSARAAVRRRPASSSSTTRPPGAWTPTCRSSSPR